MEEMPPQWQMIREAIENLGGIASNSEIIAQIKGKYGDNFSDNSLRDTII